MELRLPSTFYKMHPALLLFSHFILFDCISKQSLLIYLLAADEPKQAVNLEKLVTILFYFIWVSVSKPHINRAHMRPTLFMLGQCRSATQYHKSDLCNIKKFGFVLDATWHDSRRNALMGNNLESARPEKVYQTCRDKTKEEQMRPGKNGWKIMLTWQAMLGPATLVPMMCHHYKYCCDLANTH